MARSKEVERILKETIFMTFEDYLIQKDSNVAVFEFEDDWILRQFIMVLEMIYSDYSIKIARTSGHPTIQVFMRLEEGLWKAK